jgi:hypothetical protein
MLGASRTIQKPFDVNALLDAVAAEVIPPPSSPH